MENPTSGLVKKLEEARKRHETLSTEKEKLNTDLVAEKAAKDRMVAKLEGELNELRKERDKAQADIVVLQNDASVKAAAMKASQESLEKTRTRIETLDKEIREAQRDRDSKLKEVVRVNDEWQNAKAEADRLKQRNVQLAEEHAKALQVLRLFNLKADPGAYPEIPPVGTKGVVLAADPEYVEISIGDHDGIRKGHKLELVRGDERGSSYVGRIEIIRTTPERAVGRIDKQLMRSQPQRGDIVVDKLTRN